MARPHIEPLTSCDVGERRVEKVPFAGAGERRLSTDDETGAYTSLLSVPAGWRGDLSGSSGPSELFCLAGELRLRADRFGPGCYAYLESGLAQATLAADEEGRLLAMVEAERAPGPTGAWEVKDTEQMH